MNRSTKNILLSRLLTHSGDQAWDFAVPLALIVLFPDNIDIVALYYFMVRLLHMSLVTRVCTLIDQRNRLSAIKGGILVQTLGVALASLAIYGMVGTYTGSSPWLQPTTLAWFGGIVIAGLATSLGATVMDVAVSQDWLPTVVPQNDLARVNSRLKQIDLFTELVAPVVAGIILMLKTESFPQMGLYVIAVWNLVSFVPEYRLLKTVYSNEGLLVQKPLIIDRSRKIGYLKKLSTGWKEFIDQPAAFSMIAYATLWLTVISPHGVLLAAWMKAEWGLTEAAIGSFRGLGAVFGLGATLMFPWMVRKFTVIVASRIFIVFEAICLILAGWAFYFGSDFAIIFVVFVLLSRIGLYGFSLGETEIRQTMISPDRRGRVNGFASAITSFATLGVYGAGSLLSSKDDFSLLIYGSIGSVVLGSVIFSTWSLLKAGTSKDLKQI